MTINLLAFDTTARAGSCALWRDGVVVQSVCPISNSQASHSATLLPLTRELVATSGLSMSEIHAVAFGQGPGAFTGLRVSSALAQGFALALNVPVVGVSSLDTLVAASGAADAPDEQRLVILDARMSEIYAARYRASGEGWQREGEIVLSRADEFLPPPCLSTDADHPWQVCGNACAVYAPLQERLQQAGWWIAPGSEPDAAWVARLAAQRFLAGEVIDAADALPLYVRNKVAETIVERLAAGKRA